MEKKKREIEFHAIKQNFLFFKKSVLNLKYNSCVQHFVYWYLYLEIIISHAIKDSNTWR